MNFNNFTIKAQEAVQKASEIATGNQQQAIEPAHLLKGLLLVDENVITYLLKKLNVNINRLNETLDQQISSFPKVSGRPGKVRTLLHDHGGGDAELIDLLL